MNNDDQAPLFGSWPRAYLFTLATFLFEIVLLYLFTIRFS
jgi:hypothetical protein